jgi:hypothetical protein
MRSATAAEWILSLATTPERAASTVGDLIEEAPPRGALWFWSNVLRTASSHIWRDLRAAPLRMLGLAFAGLAAHIALLVLFEWFLNAAWKSITESLGLSFHSAVYIGGMYVTIVLKMTASAFLAGWFLAGRSKGMAAPFAAVALIAVFYSESLYHLATQPFPTLALATFCALELSVIAGAVLFRRRSLAKS